MKKLPIGISTLDKIINGDCVYVDKTQTALKLIEDGGGYFFLSRPRRFGKSLFLDTLKEIFYGNKELFKGLHIYDKYEFEKYPVIRISFGDGKINNIQDFNQNIFEILDKNKNDLGVNFPEDYSLAGKFKKLIENAYKKNNKRVVILIDEYDKPILDNIEDKEVAKEIRDELKGFYSVIKNSDEYLKFVFLTGVSKFSKVSLFSGLNNLNDITLNPNYATICGYAQSELEESFIEYLEGQNLEKIREWYNGYKWLGESVYNPYDILLFINNSYNYRNYWFSTATPTFLLKLIEKNQYFIPDFENTILDETLLDSFDVDNIKLEVLMWQTGYLTIQKQIETISGMQYKLELPNKEVQLSLMKVIADYITDNSKMLIQLNNMYKYLINRDMKSFEDELKAVYASISYNNFTKTEIEKYEGYYASVFYVYMKAIGIDIQCEETTNKGRIDAVINLPETIYVIEFKVDKPEALKQIKEKKYYEKYLNSGKQIILIGIEFSTKERNIVKLESEVVKW